LTSIFENKGGLNILSIIQEIKVVAYSNIAKYSIKQDATVEFVEDTVYNARHNPKSLSNGSEHLAWSLMPLDRIQPNFQMPRIIEMSPELLEECIQFWLKIEEVTNKNEMTVAKIVEYARIYSSTTYETWFNAVEKEVHALQQLQTQLIGEIAKHRRGQINDHEITFTIRNLQHTLDKLDDDAATEQTQNMLPKLQNTIGLEQQGFVVIGGDQELLKQEILGSEVYVLAYIDRHSEE
jgi:hypothetical protein